MIIVLQRVKTSSVTIEGKCHAQIGAGFLALVCAQAHDDKKVIQKLADKTAKLRVFSDENDKMNRSILDVEGEVLAVSQFTLAADTMSGNRPSFSKGAPPELGNRLYEAYVDALKDCGVPVKTGVFGANMEVSLVNDGPATFILSKEGVNDETHN